MGKQLLNAQEAADRLGVTEKWMRRKAQAREIPFIRLGRYLRFDPDQLDAYLSMHTVAPGRRAS
jgi:excisionase family DNA binding protein